MVIYDTECAELLATHSALALSYQRPLGRDLPGSELKHLAGLVTELQKSSSLSCTFSILSILQHKAQAVCAILGSIFDSGILRGNRVRPKRLGFRCWLFRAGHRLRKTYTACEGICVLQSSATGYESR